MIDYRNLFLYDFIIGYSFNPCQPFSEGVSCRDASVCQGKYLIQIFFFSFNMKFYLFSQSGWY